MKYSNDIEKSNILNDSPIGGDSEVIKPNSDNIVEQMVDGIMGKEKENADYREKSIRRQLSGRALEYLMFMDDDD